MTEQRIKTTPTRENLNTIVLMSSFLGCSNFPHNNTRVSRLQFPFPCACSAFSGMPGWLIHAPTDLWRPFLSLGDARSFCDQIKSDFLLSDTAKDTIVPSHRKKTRQKRSEEITMATRGITQLTRLRIFYSDWGGSSQGVREFIETKLVDWATEHPDTRVEVVKRHRRHPVVEGEYLTSGLKIGNRHQICVKNINGLEVKKTCDILANRSGRKITKIVKPVITDTPSIQGIWTPFLSLHHEPNFQVSVVEPPPEAEEDGEESIETESTTMVASSG